MSPSLIPGALLHLQLTTAPLSYTQAPVSRNSSVRNSPRQSANAEAYLCFLVSAPAKEMPRQLNS